MIDAQGFDPTLLAECQSDEKAELDELWDGEVPVQLLPERIVRDVGVPRDRARVSERDFFPLRELFRIGEVEKLVIFLFRESLPSSLDGALHASILALDRFGNVYAA